MKDNKQRYDGFGVAVTPNGPVFYYFDTDKISLQGVISLETRMFLGAQKRKQKLFKLYDIDSLGYTVIGLN